MQAEQVEQGLLGSGPGSPTYDTSPVSDDQMPTARSTRACSRFRYDAAPEPALTEMPPSRPGQASRDHAVAGRKP